MSKSVKDPRKLANELILVSLVMVGLLLAWNATTRIKHFNASQLLLAEHSVRAAASEVDLYLRGYQRAVDIFAQENRFYLSNVELWPQDMELYSELKEKIDHFFPDNLTFTMADSGGSTLLEGFEGLVGKACRSEIKAFASSTDKHTVHKHQTSEGTLQHFDIMTRWENTNAARGVFFISFKMARLENILLTSEVPGHHLLLIRQDSPGMVDVARMDNHETVPEDGVLSLADMRRILFSLPVTGTRWDVVVLPDRHLYSDAHYTILVQTFLVFIGFMIISVIMRMILLDSED